MTPLEMSLIEYVEGRPLPVEDTALALRAELRAITADFEARSLDFHRTLQACALARMQLETRCRTLESQLETALRAWEWPVIVR